MEAGNEERPFVSARAVMMEEILGRTAPHGHQDSERAGTKNLKSIRKGRLEKQGMGHSRARMAGTSWPGLKRKVAANLPAGLEREPGNRHAVNGTARTGSHARCVELAIAGTGATACELDDQTLTHELGAI